MKPTNGIQELQTFDAGQYSALKKAYSSPPEFALEGLTQGLTDCGFFIPYTAVLVRLTKSR